MTSPGVARLDRGNNISQFDQNLIAQRRRRRCRPTIGPHQRQHQRAQRPALTAERQPTGQPTLEQHPQFVRWKTAAAETELRAEMSWPDDPERRADLNIFFVHMPEARN